MYNVCSQHRPSQTILWALRRIALSFSTPSDTHFRVMSVVRPFPLPGVVFSCLYYNISYFRGVVFSVPCWSCFLLRCLQRVVRCGGCPLVIIVIRFGTTSVLIVGRVLSVRFVVRCSPFADLRWCDELTSQSDSANARRIAWFVISELITKHSNPSDVS